MGKKSTREKLMDAAEVLFAERGFQATSVRAITQEAGVNLAALNYHFGSKAGLITEVFKRRIEPINRERLQLLHQFQSEAGDQAVSLEKIMEAFLAPALRISGKDLPATLFVKLMGRIHMEGSSLNSGGDDLNELRKSIMLNFREVFIIFHELLARALPHLNPEELLWRMSFNLGAMAHAMLMVHGQHPNPMLMVHERNPSPIEEVIIATGKTIRLTSENEEKVLKFLIRYTTAGSMAASE